MESLKKKKKKVIVSLSNVYLRTEQDLYTYTEKQTKEIINLASSHFFTAT